MMSKSDIERKLSVITDKTIAETRSVVELLDDARVDFLSKSNTGIHLDLSKQRYSLEVFEDLVEYAELVGVPEKINDLFSGAKVNTTENRSALHVALRLFNAEGKEHPWPQEITDSVLNTRTEMRDYVSDIREGRITGFYGKRFKTILHIGIGGSHLGPRVIWEALRPYRPDIDLKFISGIDQREVEQTLSGLDPHTTLVVMVSKTFTTHETLLNGERVKDWFHKTVGPQIDIRDHFIGVTSNPSRAVEFGCGKRFTFEDWVGGRYSLWSSVGLSLAIALGWESFDDLLHGAHKMDEHFRTATLSENLPVMMALTQYFNVTIDGTSARTVAPYSYGLRSLPLFLQQLEMESNGKGTMLDGKAVEQRISPVVFGQSGPDCQHAFFQQLHQGQGRIPAEFIVAGGEENKPLWSAALAQARALMLGKPSNDAHRHFEGNRVSTMLILEKLDAHTLGALLALYEHKVFVEGVLWNVNSFDQYGVELGKAMTQDIERGIEDPDSLDPSTNALLKKLIA